MTPFAYRSQPKSGRLRASVTAALLCFPLAGAACDRLGGGADDAASDSAGVGGLSQEQLQQEAQPMTPEQAQQAGVADSTEAAPPSPVGPADTAPPPPAP
jgi:hypothetical protein